MSPVESISNNIKSECLRRINEEGIHRIKKCLSLLSHDQIWFKPNNNSNSVGNLTLHLVGNVTQWVISTFSNQKDQRVRDLEFDPSNNVSMQELLEKLDTLAHELEEVLETVDSVDLLESYNVQCYNETGVSILIHVIEHFSYHVGQITFFTKLILDIDTEYYANDSLNTNQ